MRLDLYLVEKKMANSRTQAQDFISNGFVYLVCNEIKKIVTKSNYIVKEDESIEVIKNQLQKYVSRAGLKLEFALNKLNLSVAGLTVLDIGQSTGGFTDCLIQHGAKKVIGIDVGHGQLHDTLKNLSQVVCFENLNVKDLSMNSNFIKAVPDNQFDLIVIDVSFISLTKVIPSIVNLISDGREYLFLVKPQFECGREYLDRNGLVKDPKAFAQVEAEVTKYALQYFKNVQSYFKCELTGKDGNQEYFIYGRKSN